MQAAFQALCCDRRGATAIEYALIALFIAIVIVAGVSAIGTSVSTIFTQVGNGL
ncbi:MAG: Flp family type IVb pilin [Thiohalocapsa sp.]